MEISDWANFWWDKITGPHKVITSVVEGLMALSKVVLKVPADLPWRHQMRNAVEDQLRTMTGSSNTIIQQIDAGDELGPSQEPGRFLLQRCGTVAAAQGYREKSGMSIQDYMIANGVLRDTIIWVKGLKKDQVDAWLQFCRGFHAKSAEDGLFLLEVGENTRVQKRRDLRVVDLSEFVREYDLQLFNSFILDEKDGYHDIWRQYAASLASHLCKTDAEVSQHLLQKTNLKQENPLEALRRVAEFPELQKRGRDEDSSHVLALVRNAETSILEHRIWSAQLQVLFPRIELERLQIIRKVYDALVTCLNKNQVEQFGQVVTSPEDVELGALEYLMTHCKGGKPLLEVNDPSLHKRVHLLRECRNALAHGECCTQDQIALLLEETLL